ncbi:MAG TPA: LiaF domain-containing protein [Polyangia bacterium]|nr:LiaF domain-containing protein [Polyangia bacterium]
MPSDDERPTGLARPDRAAQARVHDARERAIATLSDGFANDALDVDEFERRVTLAHTSESAEEIAALTSDLPAATTALAKATVALAPATTDDGVAPETVYAIVGGVDRRGTWNVPRRWRVIAAFGGAQLDLREARFPTGVIDLEVKAVFGGVQIVVPPGLAVEVHGTAIMGGFQNVNRAPAHPDPDAPLLRIHGLALMGGVDITMRLPGESERQAHRRRKVESRQERRALRQQQRADRRGQRALDRIRDER